MYIYVFGIHLWIYLSVYAQQRLYLAERLADHQAEASWRSLCSSALRHRRAAEVRVARFKSGQAATEDLTCKSGLERVNNVD